MHTLEVELVLLGFRVEVLVNLVPLWRNAFELLVWSSRYQWSFCFAHLVDHLVHFYQVLSSVEFADALLVGLAAILLLMAA